MDNSYHHKPVRTVTLFPFTIHPLNLCQALEGFSRIRISVSLRGIGQMRFGESQWPVPRLALRTHRYLVLRIRRQKLFWKKVNFVQICFAQAYGEVNQCLSPSILVTLVPGIKFYLCKSSRRPFRRRHQLLNNRLRQTSMSAQKPLQQLLEDTQGS